MQFTLDGCSFFGGMILFRLLRSKNAVGTMEISYTPRACRFNKLNLYILVGGERDLYPPTKRIHKLINHWISLKAISMFLYFPCIFSFSPILVVGPPSFKAVFLVKAFFYFNGVHFQVVKARSEPRFRCVKRWVSNDFRSSIFLIHFFKGHVNKKNMKGTFWFAFFVSHF